MFPIDSNDAYRNEDGSLTTVGEKIGSGGGGGGGGTSTIYTGNTLPDNSLGSEGDIYLYIPGDTYQQFTLRITKALRADSEVNYCGAQEIQLFLRNGDVLKNIREFPQFTASANSGSIGTAFDGNTGGGYWETTTLPAIVNFSALIPFGWSLDSLVVWQRNSTSYVDVWKDFALSLSGVPIITEENLTQADWAGIGNGTTFNIENTALPNITRTFYKVKIDDVLQWIT